MAEMQRRWLQHHPNLPSRGAALVQQLRSVCRTGRSAEQVGNIAILPNRLWVMNLVYCNRQGVGVWLQRARQHNCKV